MDRRGIEELIARVSLGDRRAFDELYAATSAKLLGVSLRVLGDRAAAEDAMQDSFIKIWHNAERYSANGLSPMTWLITIARNTAIDRRRARRETVGLETYADTLAASGPSPETNALRASEARRISVCMDELEADRRDAVRRVYLEGLSYADCAAQFERPINTIRTWLRRSLLSLRECLAR